MAKSRPIPITLDYFDTDTLVVPIFYLTFFRNASCPDSAEICPADYSPVSRYVDLMVQLYYYRWHSDNFCALDRHEDALFVASSRRSKKLLNDLLRLKKQHGKT